MRDLPTRLTFSTLAASSSDIMSFSLDDLAFPFPTPFASRSRRAMTVLFSGESFEVDAVVDEEKVRTPDGAQCEGEGRALASERKGTDMASLRLRGSASVGLETSPKVVPRVEPGGSPRRGRPPSILAPTPSFLFLSLRPSLGTAAGFPCPARERWHPRPLLARRRQLTDVSSVRDNYL